MQSAIDIGIKGEPHTSINLRKKRGEPGIHSQTH